MKLEKYELDTKFWSLEYENDNYCDTNVEISNLRKICIEIYPNTIYRLRI